jgi:crossover junction endodeoxyribonuclease RuvC
MTKKFTILGFDPGLADTGFGVICRENNKLRYLTCGSIKTRAGKNFSSRILEIYLEVSGLIKEYEPDLVAVEKLFFAKNTKTAIDVSQARGVLLLAIVEQKKTLVELTPLQVKQAVTGSGQASKRQIGIMVKTLLQLSVVPKSDDAADALAIAIAGASFNTLLRK